MERKQITAGCLYSFCSNPAFIQLFLPPSLPVKTQSFILQAAALVSNITCSCKSIDYLKGRMTIFWWSCQREKTTTRKEERKWRIKGHSHLVFHAQNKVRWKQIVGGEEWTGSLGQGEKWATAGVMWFTQSKADHRYRSLCVDHTHVHIWTLYFKDFEMLSFCLRLINTFPATAVSTATAITAMRSSQLMVPGRWQSDDVSLSKTRRPTYHLHRFWLGPPLWPCHSGGQSAKKTQNCGMWLPKNDTRTLSYILHHYWEQEEYRNIVTD